MNDFTKLLFSKQDLKYKEFSAKLIPDTKYEMIGVRVPEIKRIVKLISGEQNKDAVYSFLDESHRYYEEYMLHGLLIANLNDSALSYRYLEKFLPKIDNWAICDTVVSSLKKLAKNKSALYDKILVWIKSDEVYTVRFGIVCLLAYFVKNEYIDKLIDIILSVKTDEYYINMALAWLISVMLVKNYRETLPLIESKTLTKFVQNKAIDKARDSRRIDQTKKEYLKKYKI